MTSIVNWASGASTPGQASVIPVIEAESRPERVTLFEDRATVVRSAVAHVPPGRSVVVIDGVTPLVDDPSALATSPDPHVGVLAVRVRRRVVRRPAAAGAEMERLREESREAAGRQAEATLVQERARADELRASTLLDAWHASVARVPRASLEELPAWQEAYRTIEGSLHAAYEVQERSQREMDLAHRERSLAEARLQQGAALHPRYEAAVEVQLEVPQGGRVHLELSYRTPCALWRPEHVARLSRITPSPSPLGPATANLGSGVTSGAAPSESGSVVAVPPGPERPAAPRPLSAGLGTAIRTDDGASGFRLEMATWATVWQATGETWKDVTCRLSTARPAQSASPPLLEDDVLALRTRSEAERHSVVVEARDQAVLVAGLDRGVRAVDEMPGVDDGGEPVSLEVRAPSTLLPDGLPARLEVVRVEMPCTVDCVAWPEISEAVFVRATATWAGKVPLLAGPVRLVGGDALVGKARARFVAPGEPFEMGFGIDDSLRVRRQVTETRDTTMLVGTQKISRKVWLGVSNMSGEKRHLKVIERIPVSEIAAVKVVLVSSGGATCDESDGFARFELDVEPNATRSVELEYRIEAGAKVALPF